MCRIHETGISIEAIPGRFVPKTKIPITQAVDRTAHLGVAFGPGFYVDAQEDGSVILCHHQSRDPRSKCLAEITIPKDEVADLVAALTGAAIASA